jgi:Xaa-Pro aminopeptidase
MILSDEPGFYQPGGYGIRIENLLLVRKAELLPAPSKRFLEFETLTLVPYSRELIATDMLTAAERTWINLYHRRLMERVGPKLDSVAQQWLGASCAPL